MAKKIVRLTESDLHRIIKESVQTILKEYDETFVDKMRKRDAEEKASWDAWENSFNFFKQDNLPTSLDNKVYYDVNKVMHNDMMNSNSPDRYGFSKYHNFAKDRRGFDSMQAQDPNSHDFYRDPDFYKDK